MYKNFVMNTAIFFVLNLLNSGINCRTIIIGTLSPDSGARSLDVDIVSRSMELSMKKVG